MKNIRAIISLAESTRHVGSIYQVCNFKYFGLEKIYNFYYADNSLSLAKESSKNEREEKKLNDSSFIYGEVVCHFL